MLRSRLALNNSRGLQRQAFGLDWTPCKFRRLSEWRPGLLFKDIRYLCCTHLSARVAAGQIWPAEKIFRNPVRRPRSEALQWDYPPVYTTRSANIEIHSDKAKTLLNPIIRSDLHLGHHTNEGFSWCSH